MVCLALALPILVQIGLVKLGGGLKRASLGVGGLDVTLVQIGIVKLGGGLELASQGGELERLSRGAEGLDVTLVRICLIRLAALELASNMSVWVVILNMPPLVRKGLMSHPGRLVSYLPTLVVASNVPILAWDAWC